MEHAQNYCVQAMWTSHSNQDGVAVGMNVRARVSGSRMRIGRMLQSVGSRQHAACGAGVRRKNTWRAPCVLEDLEQPQHLVPGAGELLQDLGARAAATLSLPTKIIPAKIRWLKLSGKFPMNMRVPPLEIKILIKSNPLKPWALVRRLAVLPDVIIPSSCWHAWALLRRRVFAATDAARRCPLIVLLASMNFVVLE